MSKRTRIVALVASSVVLVGLGSAGVASYVGFDSLQAVGADDEFAYVPAGAEAVAFADVRRLLDSELGQKIQASLNLPQDQGDPGTGPFALVGVDIRKDVDSVVVAALPSQGVADRAPLVFARGRFDFNRIEALVIDRGGEISFYKGTRIAETHQPAVAVAFLDSLLVAVGQPAAVRAAIDTKTAGTGSITGDADLMRLVERVQDQSAWAVARFDALQQRVPLPPGLVSQLPAITWLAVGGQTDDGISATLYAETRNAQAAQDLREVIRGLVAIVRLQSGQRQEYADLANSIELSGEGNAVSIGFVVSLDTLEKLGVFGARRPRAAATI